MKNLSSARFLFGSLLLSQALVVGTAMADTCPSSYLCFDDYDDNTSKFGKVKGSNSYWGDFNWNDRADYFENNGSSSNVCIYQDINYNAANKSRGHYLIFKGDTFYHAGWKNEVTSNLWTKAGNCP